MNPLQLEDRHLLMVREILQRIVPGKPVWAFGSRATGRRVKTFSDLDLAVGGRLTSREHGELVEAFEESLLPIKVDLVELDGLSAAFRERIERDFVPVQDPVQNSGQDFGPGSGQGSEAGRNRVVG